MLIKLILAVSLLAFLEVRGQPPWANYGPYPEESYYYPAYGPYPEERYHQDRRYNSYEQNDYPNYESEEYSDRYRPLAYESSILSELRPIWKNLEREFHLDATGQVPPKPRGEGKPVDPEDDKRFLANIKKHENYLKSETIYQNNKYLRPTNILANPLVKEITEECGEIIKKKEDKYESDALELTAFKCVGMLNWLDSFGKLKVKDVMCPFGMFVVDMRAQFIDFKKYEYKLMGFYQRIDYAYELGVYIDRNPEEFNITSKYWGREFLIECAPPGGKPGDPENEFVDSANGEIVKDYRENPWAHPSEIIRGMEKVECNKADRLGTVISGFILKKDWNGNYMYELSCGDYFPDEDIVGNYRDFKEYLRKYDKQQCPYPKVICGIKTVNNFIIQPYLLDPSEVICCQIPPPSLYCEHKTVHETIMECDARESESRAICDYTREKGISKTNSKSESKFKSYRYHSSWTFDISVETNSTISFMGFGVAWKMSYGFGAGGGSSTEDTERWRQASSETWKESTSVSVTYAALAGELTRIRQMKGKCGFQSVDSAYFYIESSIPDNTTRSGYRTWSRYINTDIDGIPYSFDDLYAITPKSYANPPIPPKITPEEKEMIKSVDDAEKLLKDKFEQNWDHLRPIKNLCAGIREKAMEDGALEGFIAADERCSHLVSYIRNLEETSSHKGAMCPYGAFMVRLDHIMKEKREYHYITELKRAGVSQAVINKMYGWVEGTITLHDYSKYVMPQWQIYCQRPGEEEIWGPFPPNMPWDSQREIQRSNCLGKAVMGWTNVEGHMELDCGKYEKPWRLSGRFSVFKKIVANYMDQECPYGSAVCGVYAGRKMDGYNYNKHDYIEPVLARCCTIQPAAYTCEPKSGFEDLAVCRNDANAYITCGFVQTTGLTKTESSDKETEHSEAWHSSWSISVGREVGTDVSVMKMGASVSVQTTFGYKWGSEGTETQTWAEASEASYNTAIKMSAKINVTQGYELKIQQFKGTCLFMESSPPVYKYITKKTA